MICLNRSQSPDGAAFYIIDENILACVPGNTLVKRAKSRAFTVIMSKCLSCD